MSDILEGKIIKKWKSIDPCRSDIDIHTIIRCKIFPCLIDNGYNNFNKESLKEILSIRRILNTSILNSYLKNQDMKCISDTTRKLILSIIETI